MGKKSTIKVVTLVVLVLFAVSETAATIAPAPDTGITLVNATLSAVSPNSYLLKLSLSAGRINGEPNENLDLVAIPVYSLPVARPVFIYYDPNYPSSFSSSFAEVGVIDHLGYVLRSSGYGGTITTVNATELAYVLQSQQESIVVMTSGVLPDTVFNNSKDLVKPWLLNGGIMFWAGDEFGAYSGHLGQALSRYKGLNTQDAQEEILNFTLEGGYSANESSIANRASLLSSDLGLDYSSVLIGSNISSIIQHNGFVLGRLGGGRTSIGAVPVGMGWLVVFGGELGGTQTFDGHDVVAYDIFHILSSLILLSDGKVAFSSSPITKVDGQTLVASMFLSSAEVSTMKGINVFAFSSNDYSFTYFSDFLLPPRLSQ